MRRRFIVALVVSGVVLVLGVALVIASEPVTSVDECSRETTFQVCM